MEKKVKVSVCIGTRPEIIKMAPLILSLRSSSVFEVSVCMTGQHDELGRQAFEAFDIVPDVNLNIMSEVSGLANLTSKLIEKLTGYYTEFKPELVLVHGDTATAFCGALAAYYQKIQIAHIEAGLRTGNNQSPWPEEGYRTMISALADYHFAPTQQSMLNLLREGRFPDSAYVVGNTVIDALLMTVAKNAQQPENIDLPNNIKSLISGKFILVTGHRRENFDGGLVSVFKAIRDFADVRDDISIVFPAHLNPIVRSQIEEVFKGFGANYNSYIKDPVPYREFVWLMQHAHFIITDSGGIQEEAPSLGKPVVVVRETTERPEAVDAGTVVLAGTDYNVLMKMFIKLMDDTNFYHQMTLARNPYGDGTSAKIITDILEKKYL